MVLLIDNVTSVNTMCFLAFRWNAKPAFLSIIVRCKKGWIVCVCEQSYKLLHVLDDDSGSYYITTTRDSFDEYAVTQSQSDQDVSLILQNISPAEGNVYTSYFLRSLYIVYLQSNLSKPFGRVANYCIVCLNVHHCFFLILLHVAFFSWIY